MKAFTELLPHHELYLRELDVRVPILENQGQPGAHLQKMMDARRPAFVRIHLLERITKGKRYTVRRRTQGNDPLIMLGLTKEIGLNQ